MEYITSKIPAVSEKGEAGKITSYLRAHKQELNHVLESIHNMLSARIKTLESDRAGGAGALELWESEGWKCRIYTDGTAECTRRFVCEGVSCTEAWGALYISADFGGADFPFEFSEVPSVQYSISGTGARGYLLGYPSGDGSATEKNTGKWWFARGTASTAEDTVYVEIRAVGRVAG
jgi:hypothetical protein